MTGIHRAVFMLGLATFYAWVGTAASQAQPATAKPVVLVVELPAEARLTIDGNATNKRGQVRRFVSPPLPTGKRYYYTLVATWNEAGEARSVTRQISVRPGQEIRVDLTSTPPANDEPPPAKAKPAPPPDPKPAAKPVVGGPADYDAIVQKYVVGDHFDYAGLRKNKTDMARFDAFLRWQAEADLKAMSREEQIAFYINAYNSCCIKAILDHYPVHSPKDVDGFFDKIRFKVAGEELTVSQIEYDRLIANYKDMRAHFAVVCADRGCLPLRKGAYTGENLDAALEEAAKKFVKDERQFKVDPKTGEVWISKIFEWYGEKFTKDSKLPAKRPEQYLAHWLDPDTRKLLEEGKYQLKIIEWDWTLNEKLGK